MIPNRTNALNEYKLGRPSRRCSVTDEVLQPGSWYYTVIFAGDDADAVMQRREISAAAWEGPPEESLAHWKRQIPPPGPIKMVPAPPEVLWDLLREMVQFPERADSRFLLALMMLRRRLVTTLDGPPDVLRLQLTSTGETLDIQVRTIAARRAESLADQLNELTMVPVGSD